MAGHSETFQGKAVLLSLALVWIAKGAAGLDSPTLTSLEPAKAQAFVGFILTLRGGGFLEDSVVYVQATASPERFLKYDPVFISPEQLQVDLSVGLGLRPQNRNVFVKNPDGQRSQTLPLAITPPRISFAEQARSDAPDSAEGRESTPREGTVADKSSAGDEKAAPRIEKIQPAQVEAGIRFSLLVVGSGFKEGAKVMVMANTGAGRYQAPTYEFFPFEAEFLDETLLEVTFERGFFPEPRHRELYEVNPDGTMSNKTVLTVLPSLKEIIR